MAKALSHVPDAIQRVAKDDAIQRVAKDDAIQRVAKDDAIQRVAKDDAVQRVKNKDDAAARAKRMAEPLPELDRLIHERLRLGIVSALAANPSLTFNDLKRLLATTDGNLSVHARKLEEAGYIDCTKTFEGRMPKTEYSLTQQGRKALEKYLNHMEALIHAMRPRKERG